MRVSPQPLIVIVTDSYCDGKGNKQTCFKRNMEQWNLFQAQCGQGLAFTQGLGYDRSTQAGQLVEDVGVQQTVP